MTINNVVVDEQRKETTNVLAEGAKLVLQMPLHKRDSYNKKLQAITDSLQSLVTQYETVEKFMESKLNPRFIESLSEERKDLETSIANLLNDAKNLIKSMSKDVKPTFEQKKREDTIDKPFPWWIVAMTFGLLTWFIWHNHDFNSATIYNGEPILIKFNAANSGWAAMLAGCVMAAFIMVIGEVFTMLKKSKKEPEVKIETVNVTIDGEVIDEGPKTEATKNDENIVDGEEVPEERTTRA